MIANRTKQEEVDRNFAFFESELPKLLPQQAGKFALIRDLQIVGFYDTIHDAYTSGTKMYSDNLFSIQQVTKQAVDLGVFSHAMHLGTAQR